MSNLMQELQALDPKDPGRWPLPIRIGAAVVFFVFMTGLLFYLLVWNERKPELEAQQAREAELRNEFRTKHQKAVNLAVYEQQLKDIERSFGALLRQLPGKTEVPNLLVDISQTGLAAGLEEKLFQPSPEVKKDFYAELPIKIQLTGSYHEFGEFVSGIAALPRIVTLHDIEVKPETNTAYDQLTLDVTARTYRYLDEEEISAAEASKAKAAPPGAPPAPGASQ
jgi:type IV pilus assembly protein PilO